MPGRFTRFASAAGLGAMILALTGSWGGAQPEPIPLFPPGAQPPPGAAQPDPNAQPAPGQGDVEVLAKGPVHEAFAATAEAPAASPVVAKQPPDPIEELPPDQKPEGDNVQWIPGYWHWDDDSQQYIWVSGFWRQSPPGRVWVPGSFRQVEGGWQWVSGFWQEVNPLPAPGQDQQQAQQIVYLPQPPASLETGPTVPAPTVTSVYVPGSWVWRGRYVWRPGVWIGYSADWVWVPAHFVWTPMGYVFVEGYWDYVLARRGVLFAPVIVPQTVYARRGFLYTPTFVVSEPAMLGALFVRRGYTNYFFGDYFGNRYTAGGYRPWAGRVANGNFALGYGTGRNWGYDPLWSHYSVAHRADRQWQTNFASLYEGRYTGKVARPPVNLAQQNTTINKIANTNVNNVTNNITVVNKTVTVNKQDVTALAMVAPVSVAPKLQPEAKIKPVAADVRRAEAQAAKQLRAVAQERAKLEVPHAAPGAKLTEPKAVKIEVPKALVTRAHPQDQKKAPPPAPIKADQRADHTLTPKGEPKVNPKVTPKINPKGVPQPEPKVTPKGEPKVTPKAEPKGEPKGPPKIEPKVNPKVEPKGGPPTPKPEPKHEPIPHPRPKGEPPPAPKVNPPAPKAEPPHPQPQIPKVGPHPQPPNPIPKIDPRPIPPQPIPKVQPPRPKGEPPPLPKANPPAPKVGPPPPAPKAGPPAPKVEPKHEPKHEPKKEEPKKG